MTELAAPVVLGVVGGAIAYQMYKGKTINPSMLDHVVSPRRGMNSYWRNRVNPETPVDTVNDATYQNVHVEVPFKAKDGLIRVPNVNRPNGTIIGHPWMRSELSMKAPNKRLKKAASAKNYTMPTQNPHIRKVL